MVLFVILCLIALVLLAFVIGAIVAGGAAIIVVFGDVIVCIAIIALIAWLILKRRRK